MRTLAAPGAISGVNLLPPARSVAVVGPSPSLAPGSRAPPRPWSTLVKSWATLTRLRKRSAKHVSIGPGKASFQLPSPAWFALAEAGLGQRQRPLRWDAVLLRGPQRQDGELGQRVVLAPQLLHFAERLAGFELQHRQVPEIRWQESAAAGQSARLGLLAALGLHLG